MISKDLYSTIKILVLSIDDMWFSLTLFPWYVLFLQYAHHYRECYRVVKFMNLIGSNESQDLKKMKITEWASAKTWIVLTVIVYYLQSFYSTTELKFMLLNGTAFVNNQISLSNKFTIVAVTKIFYLLNLILE